MTHVKYISWTAQTDHAVIFPTSQIRRYVLWCVLFILYFCILYIIMYVVYSICLYFFCRFFCSHTIKIIFPKRYVFHPPLLLSSVFSLFPLCPPFIWSSCDCLVVLLSRFAFPVAHVSSFDLPFKSVPSSLLVYIYTHSYVPDAHVTFKINYVMGFMATTHLLQIYYNSMFFN